METKSLKALSEKVLQRNRKGNIKETSSFHIMKSAAEKFPLSGGQAEVPLEPDPVSFPATMGDLQAVFEKADSEVMAAFLPGTLALIQEKQPELWVEIQKAENKVNTLWVQTKEGIGDLEAFLEAVDRWKSLHLKAIQLAYNIRGFGDTL